MSYKITFHKEGKKKCYSVVNKNTGVVYSKCSTKVKAIKQLRLLYSVENDMSGGREYHGFLYTGKGVLGLQKAQYMGAGTELTQRLKRGDTGLTKTDEISFKHDLDYGLATNNEDIRSADLRMLRNIEKVKRDKSDYVFNYKQAEVGIKSKIFLEDYLKVPKSTFTEFGVDKLSQEEISLYREKQKELQLKGYGRLKCRF